MDGLGKAETSEAQREAQLLAALRPMAATLPESGIVAVVNYGRDKPGLVPFWAGEGDVPTPGFISEAAVAAMRDGETFYTYQRGIPPLRQAVAAYLRRHFQADVEPERVIVTGSGMQAIVQTVQALVGPGDEVVVVSPVWPNFFAAIHMQDAVARAVTLTCDANAWRLDLDRLFDACGPRTRALFINTPNNPTGWIMDPEDMIRVRDFARTRGLWIIADEVYGQFVYDRPRTTSFLELMEPEEQLIVTNTFSKNWSMTGWRLGWVVIPQSKALGQVYENLVQYNTSGAPAFLQYGGLAALNEGDAYLKRLVEQCRQGRDMVCESLAELPRVRLVPPPGAFYVFFQVKGEKDSLAFARRMVDDANVGLAPGSAFGSGGEGFLRLCFAASHETLRTGVTRLVAALT
ncbi:Aspartate aminotransferase [Candidatus Entotheonellaceae bacterium PAL068K]